MFHGIQLKNIKLILAYDGTHYLGWQKTKMGPSIEEALEKALFQILGEKKALQAASRTDRGVHAEGQVVNFLIEKVIDVRRLQKSLNAALPSDISILHVSEATPHFHPTLDSLSKEYHYHLCNSAFQLPFHRRFSWHYPASLNRETMQKSAQYLLGSHDFSAFCNERKALKGDPLRELFRIEIEALFENRLRFILVGDHFLYKMVRNIVGTLVYVGCGKLSLEQLPEILEKKERKCAGITAPAHGLILKRVCYDGSR